MAGYSGTPLATKIGLRDGLVVFLDRSPTTLDLPGTRRLPREFDVALTFHTRRSTLTQRFPALEERMRPDGMIWVCWPKKASKVLTDLDENLVRQIGLEGGLVDVKVAAVDEIWSGLKFVRRLKDR